MIKLVGGFEHSGLFAFDIGQGRTVVEKIILEIQFLLTV
jgi:hypothetical protein